MRRTVAVSGANGYLGSLLTTGFADDGWDTVRLVRSPRAAGDRPFSLGTTIDLAILDGVDLLVHCAYDMHAVARDDIWQTNVTGTEQLLHAATDAGVSRTIVLSSMSAYPGTHQLYGRAKLDIEEIARMHGAVSVRPGLVVGKMPGGMAGTLARLTKLPVTPCLNGVGRQFVLHDDNFVSAILLLAEASTLPGGPVGLAHPQPVDFATLLKGIATLVELRAPTLLPIPWRVVDIALKGGERLRVPMPLRSDSLLGLLHPAPSVPLVEYWDQLGLKLRPLGA
jgi:nucleoside-diphosphate-sugar epimerase